MLLWCCPVAELAVPAGHLRHASGESEPRSGLKVPEPQGFQTLLVAAPASSQYPPGGHSKHSVAPARSVYVPAGQLLQAIDPFLGWKEPWSHLMHAARLVAPWLGVYLPSGQGFGSTVPFSQ